MHDNHYSYHYEFAAGTSYNNMLSEMDAYIPASVPIHIKH